MIGAEAGFTFFIAAKQNYEFLKFCAIKISKNTKFVFEIQFYAPVNFSTHSSVNSWMLRFNNKPRGPFLKLVLSVDYMGLTVKTLYIILQYCAPVITSAEYCTQMNGPMR